jgi:polyhydroxyalkanoate synthesis regulator phasin
MIDLIKKSLLAGVGAAIVTKEKIEASLDDLVREGKVSAADARKMADKVVAEGRKDFHEACVQLGDKLRSVTKRVDDETKDQVRDLTRRLHELEQRLAPAKKPAGRAKPAKARTSK